MTEVIAEEENVNQLPPPVLARLRDMQECDKVAEQKEPVVDLAHLMESRSIEQVEPQAQAFPRTKRDAGSTIAERRRIPASTEKLKLYAQISNPQLRISTSNAILERFERENAELSPQASEDYLLARLERQNALLSADPKSVCIESNRLKTDFSTVRDLQQQDTTVDWEFWECLVDDFNAAATKLPHLLTAKLSRGIPDRVRGVVWRAMSQSSATHLESIYDKLVQEHSESSPYERVIQRDLSRTFPQVAMFKSDNGEGQQAMGRLLRAYSVYDAHVGYCQGLAFLVGPLLMTMPEKEAFCVFVRLMETYDMRTMFTLNMEGLHLRLHQYSTLLQQLCPELSGHLTQHGIHPAMYASQWFLTLFAYSFPIPLVLRIYDLVFAEGAVETITRVAIAVMQKNQQKLLEIDDFEELMLYLASRKLYDDAFSSCDEVIVDAMALSTIITKAKVDSLAASHQKELEKEKTQTQQVVAIRLPTKHKKRESWFSWKSVQQQQQQPMSPTSPTTPQRQDKTMQVLHQQIEDLLLALSRLQKEHSALSDEMMQVQMKDLDREAERQKLAKRNHVLEKRVKKYKLKLQQHQLSSPHMEDAEFRTFVNSLRGSGDFGALVAGALSTTPPAVTEEVERSEEDEEEEKQQPKVVDGQTDCHVNTQLAQKYDQLYKQHTTATEQLESAHLLQETLSAKNLELQAQVESLTLERDQVLEERDAIEQENDDLQVKLAAAKKTASDLQGEKLDLAKQVETLEKQVEGLEEEKRNYLMPRGSFTEEVLAAHQTLFGAAKAAAEENSRRHTMHATRDEFQAKYIESDLRCRELEKLLAEAKCKLAEYESCRLNPAPRRRSTLKTAGRMSMPTSPCSIDQRYSFAAEPRESTDSFTSTASKRSSMYSRIWNSFGTSTTATSPASSVAQKSPTLTAAKPIEDLVEEPQQI
ncbi:rab-GTPase-TBC domain-containing protein [Fennellomyces sp. T-0311]|nr:rab-GTPase-TBC domain-containing protein [Fennellomyces sp. T-0311]